ncbi:MAG: CobW family GTP-binding protein [Pseudomonadota bacterium]
MASGESKQVPVTVIGGYLGSGKTTLVNHLLRNANGRRLAILVNEFGALPIDADLIEAQDDKVISLSGGCVCCSYGNDLIMAMMDMAKMTPRPDHIVLEASGVALPGAIVSSLSLLADYTIDGVVVLADAETVQERARDKYMSDTVLRQLSDADIVLLNKIDLISEAERATIQKWLQTVATESAVVETERSVVPPEIVLRDFERPVSDGSSAHIHQTQFVTQTLACSEPVDPASFVKTLITSTPGLVRAKGFVRDEDGAMHTVQIVGKRSEITPAPDGANPGMVTITAGLPGRE